MTTEDKIRIEKLVEKEQGRLLGFIRKRIKHEEDARDIAQDVYYQLTAGFDDIRSVASLTSWLFTVARNRISDYFRKRKAELFSDQVLSAADEQGAPLMLEDILPALTRSPEDDFVRREIWETIEESLDHLPEAQREVFVLNEFEDKSFKEISELTGEGINTLLSRKRYAVTYLRRQLHELYTQMKEK